jgi:hypothetical protein
MDLEPEKKSKYTNHPTFRFLCVIISLSIFVVEFLKEINHLAKKPKKR